MGKTPADVRRATMIFLRKLDTIFPFYGHLSNEGGGNYLGDRAARNHPLLARCLVNGQLIGEAD